MVNLLVDPKGKPKGVVLSIQEYKRLLARLEDLEDALELKEAQEQVGEFEDLDVVLARLDLRKRP
ncbi:MAG: hypothetical protein HW403_63 [Dehalococcoidia bacterium]|nr:hypothetical protein [Dehalococcoidia bacterium]